MKARLKTQTQDVWQHNAAPVLHSPSWVLACVEWRDDGIYLVRGPDKQRIEIGDWLLRDLDGAPTWSTDADFRRQYEVVE